MVGAGHPPGGLGLPCFLPVQMLHFFLKAFCFRCCLSGERVENLGHQNSYLPDGAELTREVGGKLIAGCSLEGVRKTQPFNWAGEEGQL